MGMHEGRVVPRRVAPAFFISTLARARNLFNLGV
jgi:hypothetical protein